MHSQPRFAGFPVLDAHFSSNLNNEKGCSHRPGREEEGHRTLDPHQWIPSLCPEVYPGAGCNDQVYVHS